MALKRAARIALFIPPLVVGYAFAMAALAAFLSGYWGRLAALASVAGLQIVVGGIGLRRTLSTLRRTPILERTGAEMTGDVEAAMAVLSESRSVRVISRPHLP